MTSSWERGCHRLHPELVAETYWEQAAATPTGVLDGIRLWNSGSRREFRGQRVISEKPRLDASIWGVALVGLALLLFVGCDPGDPGPRGEVAVSSNGQGISLTVLPCESEALVASVALTIGTGQAGREGETIWAIES